MTDTNPTQIHALGEATGFIPAPGDKGKPITVIGTYHCGISEKRSAQPRGGSNGSVSTRGRPRLSFLHGGAGRDPESMSYVIVDVESDGPIPVEFSMVCFGAVVFDDRLDKTFYGRTPPISDRFVPEALAVSRFYLRIHT